MDKFKAALILILLGISVGLLTGITDSLIHYINLQDFKLINIFIFLLFFTALSFAYIIFRNKILGGFSSYLGTLINNIILGTIAGATIALVRYIYLNFIAKINIEEILDKTEQTMLEHYDQYGDELIDNRLSFIEFSYDPVISSLLYFAYFMFFVVIFAIIGSFFLKRIDRNITI